MAYHNVATSPSPLDGVMDAPLPGRTFSWGTAMGIPFSFTRAIRAGSFWRQNSFQADILSILVQIVQKSLFVCLKMASKVPTEAEEVSRVNKLLQIEDLVWKKQLEKAVGGFYIIFFFFSVTRALFPLIYSLLKGGSLFLQGFKDTSLTVWDASSILRNYEVRTGHILSREELDTGYLTDRLIDADYDLTTSVSVLFPSLPLSTFCNTPRA